MLTMIVRRSLFAILAFAACSSIGMAADANWAEKMFSEMKHDFGFVARGADVQHTITIKNIYKEQVHIQGVRTTCGCSKVEPTRTTLNSNETSDLVVTIDTRRFMHKKDPNIIVTFDAPLYAEVKIPMEVYIRTDVVLTPGAVNFGIVDVGKGAEREVDIDYAGRSDWKIQGIQTNNTHLQATAQEVKRDGTGVKYKLAVKLDSAAPAGPLNQQITLITDDAANPHVPVLVQARVEADITVTPSVLSFGALTPGQPKTQNIVIRGRQPFTVERIECESDREIFAVRLPDGEKAVQVLPITITPPSEPGKLTEKFTVTIKGRPEPVTFEAFGTIAESTAAKN